MRHTAIGESHEESSEMGAWRSMKNNRERTEKVEGTKEQEEEEEEKEEKKEEAGTLREMKGARPS